MTVGTPSSWLSEMLFQSEVSKQFVFFFQKLYLLRGLKTFKSTSVLDPLF